MLPVSTWAEKDEVPSKWLCQGSTVIAVADTGCTKTLVSEAFANRLSLRMNVFPEGKALRVCLGNSDMVTPGAAVNFWAVRDLKDANPGEHPRRKISALVLPKLPTTILISGDDLVSLCVLPPKWPNHGKEWGMRIGEPPRTDFPANGNLSEKEVYTNAMLVLSLGDGIKTTAENELAAEESMEVDVDGGELYDSKMAIPDTVFDTDTDVSLIPGYKEGRLPPRIKAIYNKYARVFKKSLTAHKRTAFKPATLPIKEGAKPSRRATTCCLSIY